jgi:hypothetical protein
VRSLCHLLFVEAILPYSDIPASSKRTSECSCEDSGKAAEYLILKVLRIEASVITDTETEIGQTLDSVQLKCCFAL